MALNGIRDMPISNPMHALLILVATEASSGWSDMSIEESSSSAISVGYVGMGKNYRKKWLPTEAKISWFGRWSGMKAFEGCRIDSLFQEGNVRPDSRDISTQRKTIAKIAAITNILIKGLYDKLCMMTKKKKRKGQSLDKNIYCPVTHDGFLWGGNASQPRLPSLAKKFGLPLPTNFQSVHMPQKNLTGQRNGQASRSSIADRILARLILWKAGAKIHTIPAHNTNICTVGTMENTVEMD